MKFITRLIALAIPLVLAGGCGDVLAFDLNAEVDEFTVPGDADLHHAGAPLAAGTVPSIDVQLGAVQPDSVSLSGLRFYATDTALKNDRDEDGLEFLTAIDVFIVPANRDSGLPELKVATWTGPVEVGAREIKLKIETETDLSPYISAGFTLDAVTRGVVPFDDVSIKGDATFRVNPF